MENQSLNPLFGFNYSNYHKIASMGIIYYSLNPLFGFNYSNQNIKNLPVKRQVRVSIPYLVLITQTADIFWIYITIKN